MLKELTERTVAVVLMIDTRALAPHGRRRFCIPDPEALSVALSARREAPGMDSAVIVPGPDNAQVGQDMSCDARYTSVLAHPTPQASVEPAPRSTVRNVECDSHRPLAHKADEHVCGGGADSPEMAEACGLDGVGSQENRILLMCGR